MKRVSLAAFAAVVFFALASNAFAFGHNAPAMEPGFYGWVLHKAQVLLHELEHFNYHMAQTQLGLTLMATASFEAGWGLLSVQAQCASVTPATGLFFSTAWGSIATFFTVVFVGVALFLSAVFLALQLLGLLARRVAPA